VLIGAHVSPAGGPAKALERGREKGCEAIQIFNQNPRAWKPREYRDEEISEWDEARPGSGVEALLIHAVYLLNCASEDDEMRGKSLASLIASLDAGRRLGAHAVVLHPGSALRGEVEPAIARAGAAIREALDETEGCALHLENTAGAGGTLGRSFGELAAVLEAAGGDARLGVCLDSCHLYASGYDVASAEGIAQVLDDFDAEIGLDRLGSLHFNDSATPFGSNRDRHANVGEGELGEAGALAWIREPRFSRLPCVLETPGPDGKGPAPEEIERLKAWRDAGAQG
jgi:deoxyribonuclease IV